MRRWILKRQKFLNRQLFSPTQKPTLLFKKQANIVLLKVQSQVLPKHTIIALLV